MPALRRKGRNVHTSTGPLHPTEEPVVSPQSSSRSEPDDDLASLISSAVAQGLQQAGLKKEPVVDLEEPVEMPQASLQQDLAGKGSRVVLQYE